MSEYDMQDEGWVIHSVVRKVCDTCPKRVDASERQWNVSVPRSFMAELYKRIGQTELAAVLSSPEMIEFEKHLGSASKGGAFTKIDVMFGYRWIVTFKYLKQPRYTTLRGLGIPSPTE